MSSQRKVIHGDNKLCFASNYLKFHIKMYVETALSLQDQIYNPTGSKTVKNAILDSHLIHARILIQFLSKSDSYVTDVLAIDYFYDLPNKYQPLNDDFLNSQAEHIGSRLVHITTKPMFKLKSQQEWPIGQIAEELVPALKAFLEVVPENRLVEGVKNECLIQLAKLSLQRIPFSSNASS